MSAVQYARAGLAVTALLLAACSVRAGDKDSAEARVYPTRSAEVRFFSVSVAIPAGGVERETLLSISRATPPREVPLIPLGRQVNISIGSALKQRATVMFRHDHGLLQRRVRDVVGLGYFDPAKQRWVLVRSRVDLQRGAVSAETDHFSVWTTWVGGPVGWLERAVGGLLKATALRADPPSCRKKPADVVTVAPDPLRDVILGCMESKSSGAVVRVTNNRGYSTSVLPPPEASISGVSFGGLDAAIGQALAKNKVLGDLLPVYVPAGQTATFNVPGPLRGQYAFRSSPNHITVALDLVWPWFSRLLGGVSGIVAQERLVNEFVECLSTISSVTSGDTRVHRLAELGIECAEQVAVQGGLALPGAFEQFNEWIDRFGVAIKLGDLAIDHLQSEGLGEVTFDLPETSVVDHSDPDSVAAAFVRAWHARDRTTMLELSSSSGGPSPVDFALGTRIAASVPRRQSDSSNQWEYHLQSNGKTYYMLLEQRNSRFVVWWIGEVHE